MSKPFLRGSSSWWLGYFAVATVQFAPPSGWIQAKWSDDTQVWSRGAKPNADVLTLSKFAVSRQKPLTEDESKSYAKVIERVRSRVNKGFGISNFRIDHWAFQGDGSRHDLKFSGTYQDAERGEFGFYERQIFAGANIYQLQLSYSKSSKNQPTPENAAMILDGLRVGP